MYEAHESKKATNAEKIKNCKNILRENRIDLRDEYLPKLSADKTLIEGSGIFDKLDLSKFDLSALIKNGLTKTALKHFASRLTFNEAILCDDIDVYIKAYENDYPNINWALESLSSELLNYYEIIVCLIDSGAQYYMTKSTDVHINNEYANDCCQHAHSCIIEPDLSPDISKTRFIYRVAKDMIKGRK